MVLAMAAYGARGNTAKQMRAGLHLSEDDSAGRNSYRKLMNTFAVSNLVINLVVIITQSIIFCCRT